MGIEYWSRRRIRAEALEQLETLMKHAPQVYLVHYANEGFDVAAGRSSRVVSIVVANLRATVKTSFSICEEAELLGVPPADIDARFPELERRMLDGFYRFIQQHGRLKWVHWSMRDSKFGFPALAHRYRLLGGEPVDIPDDSLFDLAKILSGKYSSAYASQPRLVSIMSRNQISSLDFLSGAEEAEAVARGDYRRVLGSTLRKVDTMAALLERAADDRLKHEAKRSDVYGVSARGVLLYLKEHPILTGLSVFGVLGTAITRFHDVVGLVSKLVGH